MPAALTAWSTIVPNLPEHADNPVHTDEGARAAGFAAAIVAGTTVHACLTRPVVAGWGIDWLRSGWSEVRFLAPVLDGDELACVPVEGERTDGSLVEGRVDGEVRATLAVRRTALSESAADSAAVGEPLPAMTVDLADGVADYGRRAGDDLTLYADDGLAHPSSWTVIGNRVTRAHLVDGPWVHVRSAITHLDVVAADAVVDVTSTLTDRFDTRAGERVIVDLRVHHDGRPIAVVEHESIVRLAS